VPKESEAELKASRPFCLSAFFYSVLPFFTDITLNEMAQKKGGPLNCYVDLAR
jgi:hypothetical protein